jgi:hypothetical protein
MITARKIATLQFCLLPNLVITVLQFWKLNPRIPFTVFVVDVPVGNKQAVCQQGFAGSGGQTRAFYKLSQK